MEESYKIGSVHPSVLPSRRFLGIVSLVFSEISHGRNLCVTELDFLGKLFLPQNWEKGPKMGQKQGFFEFIGKFGH